MTTATVKTVVVVQEAMLTARLIRHLIETYGMDNWTSAANDLAEQITKKITLNIRTSYDDLETAVGKLIVELKTTYDLEEIGLTKTKLLEILAWRVYS